MLSGSRTRKRAHSEESVKAELTAGQSGHVPDCRPTLSARLPAITASQMVHSVIMAAIRGSLVLISTPTEHNVHNNVCSIPGCTTSTVSKQTVLQTVKLSIYSHKATLVKCLDQLQDICLSGKACPSLT